MIEYSNKNLSVLVLNATQNSIKNKNMSIIVMAKYSLFTLLYCPPLLPKVEILCQLE